MNKKQKLILKILNGSSNITFKEFELMLSYLGFEFDRQRGSHRIWYSPENIQFNIQPTKKGMVKKYQLKLLVNYYKTNYE